MKIAIVGADRTKWTRKQVKKAKIEIKKILICNFGWLCVIK